MKDFFKKDALSIIVAIVLLFFIEDIKYFILFVFVDFSYRAFVFADIHFKLQQQILKNIEKE